MIDAKNYTDTPKAMEAIELCDMLKEQIAKMANANTDEVSYYRQQVIDALMGSYCGRNESEKDAEGRMLRDARTRVQGRM